MKMAKQQDLPLNPAKISGVCGRLLCCLGYECAQYKEMKAKLPTVGSTVVTSEGEARVIGGNPLKETVVAKLESDAILEVRLSDLVKKGNAKVEPRIKRRRRK
jgi:cell fate regulator YaaT (PSP1 superfamily)